MAWINGEVVLTLGDEANSEKTVRLVQPNAAQHLKWQADMIPQFFRAQLDMTSGAREAGVDLVVWPETAVGYRLNSSPEAMEWIKQTANGVPIVFGGNSFLDGKVRNTLAYMGPSGSVEDWYYKHHLVPFGEYIPGGELLGQWGVRGLAARDGAGYAAGQGPQLIDIEGIGKVLPLICYELIFPRHLRTDERPELILQITNDAWFGEISGPYQHLAQAKFRAVEQGLPLIRVANTGVSAVIDPFGRVTAQIPLGVAGAVDAKIPMTNRPTFYSKTGDTPLLILMVLVLAGLFAARGLGRRHDG
jgi:apolipoprotein N-acyltransferase